MLIAIPHTNECDAEDQWDALMRDLRDDVPDIHLMPAFTMTVARRQMFHGVDALVFTFCVHDELAQQLRDSAYAQCSDIIIEG